MSKHKFQRNLALIVGINNYQKGIPPLKTAVNDAKKLTETLRTKHGYKIWVCLDEIATLQNLTKFLEKTLPEQVKADDRLLFYFAGHGIALNGDDGPAGYLIPQDASVGDIDSYLPMTKLHDALSKLPCRHFLGILDCCFAGAFRWSSNRDVVIPTKIIHKERYDRFITDPAWQVITSSASDQKALDNFKLDTERIQVGEHSPFATALLEALEGAADAYPPAINGQPRGDGVITATELYMYLRDRVEIPTEKISHRQTPGIWCLNKHDKGEYIFLSPGHKLNLPPAPPLDESQNPYRGLEPFEAEHSELFFGRSELVKELHNFVKAHPLTVVLGASGSGKSSLVKAGLIPKLKRETEEKWSILSPIRPGERPFQALNQALAKDKLEKVELQKPQKTLAESVAVWAKKHPDSQLLIFIDQSEELITLCADKNERTAFFQQILTALIDHRHQLRVVLTLRSDFEPQIRDGGLEFVYEQLKLRNTLFKKHWQSGRFIVPAMSRSELREAIEKPAEAKVMYFDPHDLVEELIEEVADMPGALPLLSFALSELFFKYLRRQREAENRGETIDRAITQKDYEELGGVVQSLTQSADEQYEKLVKQNPAYKEVIRHVMLRMVAMGGGELARRRVPWSELEYPPEQDSLVKEVVEQFSAARLLVKGRDGKENTYVEPAHDALVRGWKRLLAWKQEEEESLILQRRLTPAAQEWKKQKQAKFLWNNNPRLDLLKKELRSNNNWLNKLETEFVERSVKRKNFNTRRNWGITIAVTLGLATGLIFSLIGQQNALKQEINALIEASEANLLSNNQLDAIVGAVKAKKQLDNIWIGKKKVSLQVLNVLRKTLHHHQEGWREQLRLRGRVIESSFVGQRLVTVDNDIVKLWNASTGEKLHTFQGYKNPILDVALSLDSRQIAIVFANEIELYNLITYEKLRTLRTENTSSFLNVAFSPDGQLLASSSFEDTAQVWNAATGELLQHLKQENINRWSSLVFSPNSEQLAISSVDKIVLWNTSTGETLQTFSETSDPKVFSPDSKQLAISSGNTMQLKDISTGKLLQTFQGHKEPIINAAFSPNGKQLATSSEDKTARLWDITTGDNLQVFQGHKNTVQSVTFSADGKQVATSSFDETVIIWNVSTGELLNTLQGHEDIVGSAEFSLDGKQLLTSSADGTTRLWDIATRELFHILEGDEDGVQKMVFSPNSKQLAIVYLSNEPVKLWDVVTGELLHPLEGHTGEVLDVAFSHDSQTLATASADTRVGLWDVATGELLHPLLQGHTGGVLDVAFSSDNKILVTASDTTVGLWDVNKGKLLFPLLQARETRNSIEVAFSPRSQKLATVSGQTVQMWNSATGQNIFPLQGHRDSVSSMEFSSDGKQLATASYDRTVRLWDVVNHEPLQILQGHKEGISEVTFSPNGKWLATASYDQTIRLWRVGDIEDMQAITCDWVRHYLKNHPDVENNDRNLCD